MRLFGVSLGEGNTKVGDVFTFSLPSKTTCPGASAWCLKHCYAFRLEQIRPACRSAYGNNLTLTANIEQFERTMIGVLPRIMPCFRIHVGGDFHEKKYVDAWRRICEAFPQTRFWSYTRSWNVPELLADLEELRALSNVQLFASTDPTMPLPPKGWRAAYIIKDIRAKGRLCSQQTGSQESCLACGYCYRQTRGDVVFHVH